MNATTKTYYREIYSIDSQTKWLIDAIAQMKEGNKSLVVRDAIRYYFDNAYADLLKERKAYNEKILALKGGNAER